MEFRQQSNFPKITKEKSQDGHLFLLSQNVTPISLLPHHVLRLALQKLITE
jgi:hypothetical protein